jgi:hypothetical protein
MTVGDGLTWADDELELLRSGVTTDEFRSRYPHRSPSSVNSQRYLDKKRRGIEEPAESDLLVGSVLSRPDKKIGHFHWREANKAIKEMQALSTAAKSSQDYATIKIATDEPVFVLFLSDSHLGDWATDYDLFERITDEILSTPNLYVALLGDMVNLAIAMRSVGEVTSGNLLPPELQVEYFTSWMDDVKDRILFATWSNHDIMREEKGTGISAFRSIQERRVVYHNGIGHPDVVVGGETYRLAVSHRFRGNSIENPCHATMRYLRREGHDRELAAMGDIHQPGIIKFNHGPTPKVAINTGSTQLNSTYARRHFSLFTSPVMPGVLLHPDRHQMTPYWSVSEWKSANV